MQFEKLEERIYLDATPLATLMAPSDGFINDVINGISLEFDNTGTMNAGYGPYVEMLFDPEYDTGSMGATYLGSSLTLQTITYNGSGVPSTTTHPLTQETLATIPGRANHVLIVFDLPFGSFVPTQPPAKVEFTGIRFDDTSNPSLVGNPQPIALLAGFKFGEDALNNPGTDPIIKSGTSTTNINMLIYKVSKSSTAPGGEKATGPNYPFDYVLDVDIAAGKTLSNLILTDTLHDGFVVTNVGIVGSNGVNTQSPPSTPFGPGSNLVIDFDDEPGTASASDVTVTMTGYFTEHKADTFTDVIPEATGISTSYNNAVSTVGTFVGFNFNDSDNINTNANSLTSQSSVAVVGGGSATPGKTLEFTIDFQVSDYFSFKDLIITDTLGDGLNFDGTFTPTLNVHENGVNTSRNIDGANFSANVNGNITDLVFNISDDLVTAGQDANLDGDLYLADATQTAGTTARVTYRAVIRENFREGAKGSVDVGDSLGNSALVSGNLKDESPDVQVTDSSSAAVSISGIAVSKTLFSVDGATPPNNNVLISKSVGYKLTITYDSSDTEGLAITDYLPLPVFDVSDINGGTTPYDLAPTVTVPTPGSLNPGDLVVVASASVTAGLSGGGGTPAGQVKVTTNGAANTLRIDFFDISVIASGTETIDIYFALNTQNQPMANDLTLTNQLSVAYANSSGSPFPQNQITQIIIQAPDPRLMKGVVSTSPGAGSISGSKGPSGVSWKNPGTSTPPFTGTLSTYDADNTKNIVNNPVVSNLNNADAGDIIRIALVAINTGGQNAEDFLIKDVLPTGYSAPAGGYNILITTGGGTAYAFTDFEDSGATTINNSAKFATALFGSGVQLKNSNSLTANGLISEESAIAGGNNKNTLIITYDIELEEANTHPKATLTNTANIEKFSPQAGGPNWVAGNTNSNWQDTADTNIAVPSLAKIIQTTSVNADTSSTVVIGEIVTYRLNVTVPEGQLAQFRIADAIPTGMELYSAADGGTDPRFIAGTFVGIVRDGTGPPGAVLNNNDPVSFSSTGGDGDDVTFTFGNINVTGDNITTNNTFSIEYDVLIRNVAGNQNNTNRSTSAVLSYDNSAVGGDDFLLSLSAVTHQVTIREPQLNIAKTVLIDGSGTTGDAGDTVQYTLVISRTSGSSGYDISLSDSFPTEITGLSLVSATHSIDGDISSSFVLAGQNLSLSNTENINLATTQTITLVLSGTLGTSVQANSTIDSTTNIQWTSTPGANANERNGSGGINDYTASDGAPITVLAPTVSLQTPSPTTYAIGDVINFTSIVTLPEGITPTLIFVDDLDFGLEFLSDSITVTRSSSAITTDAGATDFTDMLTGTLSNSDRKLTINLGNITNTNTVDGTPETLTITYSAFVTNDTDANNVKDNIRGNSRSSVSSLTWTGAGAGSANNNKVITIIEPTLKVTKIITPTTGEAGTAITYTITIQHDGVAGSNADAFDLALSDTLPTEIENATISSVTGAAVIGDFDLTANVLTITGNVDLPSGQTIIIEVTGTIAASAMPAQVINNNANTQWTSLNGIPSLPQVERDGSGTPAPVNDYTDSTDTPTSFTVAALTLLKSIIASTEASTNASPGPAEEFAVGETVTYRFVNNIPQGTVTNLQIQEFIPSGMQYVNGSARIAFLSNGAGMTSSVFSSIPGISGAGLNINGSNPVGISPSFALPDLNVSTSSNPASNDDNYTPGTDVFFRLGSILNSDNDGDAEYIIIEFDALVPDIIGNTQGLAQNNSYQTFINTISAGTSNTVQGKIVFPELALASLLVSPPAEPEVGDVITYRITLDHNGSSGSAAHEITLTDTLPDTLLEIVPGSIVISGTNSITGGTFTIGGTNNNLIQTATPFSLALGENLILTYQATVTSSNSAGDSLTNDVQLNYDSILGANANQRSSSASDNKTITIYAVDIQLTKTNPDTIRVPGQSTTYTLTITNPAGAFSTTADAITVTETLPLGLSYVSSSLTPTSISGQILTWNLSNLAPGSSQVITVTATANNPAPVGIVSLVNGAEATLNSQIDPNLINNEDSISITLNASPDLTVTKSSGLTDAIPGLNVPYTITITNNGNQNSGLVSVVDTFPDTILDVSAISDGGVQSVGTITWNNLASIPGNGGVKVLTIAASVKDPVDPIITSFTNSLIVSEDSGIEAGNVLDSDNTDSEMVNVIAAPDYSIIIESEVESVIQGQGIDFKITVDNTGNQIGTNIEIKHIFPLGYIGSIADATDNPGLGIHFLGVQAGTAPDTEEIHWLLDTLNIGQMEMLNYTVNILETAPATTTFITTATVMDDLTNGPDLTPENNTADYELTVFPRTVFSFDGFNDFRPSLFKIKQTNSSSQTLTSTQKMIRSAAFAPIYTGKAIPGTIVLIDAYDAKGNLIDNQMTMTDTGGNWMSNIKTQKEGQQVIKIVISRIQPQVANQIFGDGQLKTNYLNQLGGLIDTHNMQSIHDLLQSLAHESVTLLKNKTYQSISPDPDKTF